jgi:hypothetical protein
MKQGCGRIGTSVGVRTGGLTVSLALLAACAGHDGGAIPNSGGAPTQRRNAEARFTIKVPKKRPRRHRIKRPGYVSTYTNSLKLTIVPAAGGAAVVSKTVNVTPSSVGCATVSGSTMCSFVESLPPGSYVVSVEAYDGLGGAGNLLSAAQRVPFTALAGNANTVALTLSGVAHTLVAQGPAPAVRVFDSGMRLYGAGSQPFTLTAKDSDGESIVGPGAPRLSASLKSGSGWTLATPSPQAPTVANLTPPNVNGSAATFEVDAAYDDDTCALGTAVCQTSFAVTNDIQTMFVEDAANGFPPAISIYTPVSATSPTATISNGLTAPIALGIDASLDLFVLDGTNVLEYEPPYTGAPLRTISVSNASMPTTMSVSLDGHFALADSLSSWPPTHSVWVYAPPYTGPPVQIAGDFPNGLAFDASNDLFVASSSLVWNQSSAETVLEYAPPYSGAPTLTLSSGLNEPGALAFDHQGDLFVANINGPNVMEYAPPYGSSSPVTISAGMTAPWTLSLDYDGDLFVSNAPTNGPGVGTPITLAAYTSPYASAPTMFADIPNGGVPLVAVDNSNDVHMTENCNCGIYYAGALLLGFAPSYSGSPYTSAFFNNPWAVLITP